MGRPDAAQRILRRFLVDGRLVAIPAAWGRRMVVLGHPAGLFEPGRRYPEQDVNATVRAVHPDSVMRRRYLVDEGFLDREAGVYWRTGGTFEV